MCQHGLRVRLSISYRLRLMFGADKHVNEVYLEHCIKCQNKLVYNRLHMIAV